MPRPKNKLSPHALQALVVCAAVLACAAIYFFISGTKEAGPFIQVHLSPSPIKTSPTPTAAPVKGVRESVFIDRLLEKGIAVEVADGANGSEYSILHESEGEAYTLSLSLGKGYVLGFTLSVQVMEKPQLSSKNPTEIERRLLEAYQSAIVDDHTQMEALLPKLMSALATDGYFPPATALYWAGVAAKAREDGELIMEQAGDYLFTASYRKGKHLAVSVAIE